MVGKNYYRPTLNGPKAEERAAREHEVIYAKRDLVKEQLQGMADRDEKRRWVGEYWAVLLGVSAPVLRPFKPRGPRVPPLKPTDKRTLREPKVKVKAKEAWAKELKKEL